GDAGSPFPRNQRRPMGWWDPISPPDKRLYNAFGISEASFKNCPNPLLSGLAAGYALRLEKLAAWLPDMDSNHE
ncbi:MAG TPA: hypothetical protein VIS74_07745, partial [Chthoniobacterales bacterium]